MINQLKASHAQKQLEPRMYALKRYFDETIPLPSFFFLVGKVLSTDGVKRLKTVNKR